MDETSTLYNHTELICEINQGSSVPHIPLLAGTNAQSILAM